MIAINTAKKKNKHDGEGEYRMKGMIAGVLWANMAQVEELKDVIVRKPEILEYYDQYGCISEDKIRISKALYKYFITIFDKEPLFDFADDFDFTIETCLNKTTERWFLGWLDAVEVFWNTVKDKLWFL